MLLFLYVRVSLPCEVFCNCIDLSFVLCFIPATMVSALDLEMFALALTLLALLTFLKIVLCHSYVQPTV